MVSPCFIPAKAGIRAVITGLLLVFLAAFPADAAVHTDALGRTVEIPTSPQRIVSLAPNITETLFGLGLDDEIVGVTTDSVYPEAARSRPKVGGLASLSLERVIALDPDCIIATADGNPKEPVLQLARAGFPVYVTNPRDLDGMLAMIVDLGIVTGRRKRAEELAAGLRRRIEAVAAATAGRARPRVFFQVASDPLITVGGGTFHDRLMELAGGINIFSLSPVRYPRVNVEMVVAGEPEVIVLASMGRGQENTSQLARWKRWPGIPAVSAGRLHRIDAGIIHQPSPRIVDGLEVLTDFLHPGWRNRPEGQSNTEPLKEP
jgi:iron complex transport system substrate-binding protein